MLISLYGETRECSLSQVTFLFVIQHWLESVSRHSEWNVEQYEKLRPTSDVCLDECDTAFTRHDSRPSECGQSSHMRFMTNFRRLSTWVLLSKIIGCACISRASLLQSLLYTRGHWFSWREHANCSVLAEITRCCPSVSQIGQHSLLTRRLFPWHGKVKALQICTRPLNRWSISWI